MIIFRAVICSLFILCTLSAWSQVTQNNNETTVKALLIFLNSIDSSANQLQMISTLSASIDFKSLDSSIKAQVNDALVKDLSADISSDAKTLLVKISNQINPPTLNTMAISHSLDGNAAAQLTLVSQLDSVSRESAVDFRNPVLSKQVSSLMTALEREKNLLPATYIAIGSSPYTSGMLNLLPTNSDPAVVTSFLGLLDPSVTPNPEKRGMQVTDLKSYFDNPIVQDKVISMIASDPNFETRVEILQALEFYILGPGMGWGGNAHSLTKQNRAKIVPIMADLLKSVNQLFQTLTPVPLSDQYKDAVDNTYFLHVDTCTIAQAWNTLDKDNPQLLRLLKRSTDPKASDCLRLN